MKTIQARVQPQVFNHAYPNIPENAGEALTLDVTEKVLSMGAREIAKIQDDDWTSELLIIGRIGHPGPRSVRVEDSIKAFFGVESLGEITEAMLGPHRQRKRQSAAQTPADL